MQIHVEGLLWHGCLIFLRHCEIHLQVTKKYSKHENLLTVKQGPLLSLPPSSALTIDIVHLQCKRQI